MVVIKSAITSTEDTIARVRMATDFPPMAKTVPMLTNVCAETEVVPNCVSTRWEDTTVPASQVTECHLMMRKPLGAIVAALPTNLAPKIARTRTARI